MELCHVATFFIALYCFVSTVYNYDLKDIVVENNKPVKIFTSDEMKEFDDSDKSKPIYMAIKGVVFDVSEGRRFYGKDGPYNSLVGKDSTRACAKMSLQEEDLTHDITDLSDSDLKALDDVFEGTYMTKYPVVGYMDYLLDSHPDKFKDIGQKNIEL